MHIEKWYFKDMVLLNIELSIQECLAKLLTENNAGALYEAQGKIEGLKVGRDKIITEFGAMDGTMSREDVSPEICNLSKSALEHFSEDIDQNRDRWVSISEFAGGVEERSKTDLWEGNTLVSRDFKRGHGKRDGLRVFEKLMDEITNTLVEVKENPNLPGMDEEEDNTVEFPQGEFDDLDQAADDAIDEHLEGQEESEEDQDYETQEEDLETGTGE